MPGVLAAERWGERGVVGAEYVWEGCLIEGHKEKNAQGKNVDPNFVSKEEEGLVNLGADKGTSL